MIKLLVKTFIKDHEETKNPKVREKYGVLGGVLGIICNIILFVVKLVIGIFLNGRSFAGHNMAWLFYIVDILISSLSF